MTTDLAELITERYKIKDLRWAIGGFKCYEQLLADGMNETGKRKCHDEFFKWIWFLIWLFGFQFLISRVIHWKNRWYIIIISDRWSSARFVTKKCCAKKIRNIAAVAPRSRRRKQMECVQADCFKWLWHLLQQTQLQHQRHHQTRQLPKPIQQWHQQQFLHHTTFWKVSSFLEYVDCVRVCLIINLVACWTFATHSCEMLFLWCRFFGVHQARCAFGWDDSDLCSWSASFVQHFWR